MSASASSASCLAAGNWPRWARTLALVARHRAWASKSSAAGQRLGFFGQPLRLAETPLRVLRLGETRQHGGEKSGVPRRAQRIVAFLSSGSAAAGSPAIISMRPARAVHMAESISAPDLVCADWARLIAARASAKRPA